MNTQARAQCLCLAVEKNSSEKAMSAVPRSVRPRRDYQRFWHGLNIVTFLVACLALVLVLAHMAKGAASGAASSGGVKASAVYGLPAWQDEVTRNLTTVQSDLAVLICRSDCSEVVELFCF